MVTFLGLNSPSGPNFLKKNLPSSLLLGINGFQIYDNIAEKGCAGGLKRTFRVRVPFKMFVVYHGAKVVRLMCY